MDLFIGIAVFLFGVIVGSFLNVVILRFNTGRSLLGRSHCMSCGHQLSVVDLIPFLGYVVNQGRCKYCKSRISAQYPLVEMATGLLFLMVFYIVLSPLDVMRGTVDLASSVSALIYGWIIVSLLVLITAYDMYHKIIPNAFVYPLVGLSFFGLFFDFSTFAFALPEKGMLLAGPALAAPLGLLWLVSRGRWMGFGDAKLELALGWLLGLSKGFAALLISFWAGALVGLLFMVVARVRSWQGNYGWKSELPFGPFLILGFLMVWMGGVSLVDLLSIFSL